MGLYLVSIHIACLDNVPDSYRISISSHSGMILFVILSEPYLRNEHNVYSTFVL
jgi:hypothetical protein